MFCSVPHHPSEYIFVLCFYRENRRGEMWPAV
uniref:Uncharacterized protein n=1 Tax=Anguilla anguilla TaxID=7936 RepID=A0A0E9U2Q1_ANGAN